MHGGGALGLRGIGAPAERSGDLSRTSSASSSAGAQPVAAGPQPPGDDDATAVPRTSPQLGLLSARVRSKQLQSHTLTLGTSAACVTL